MTKKGEIHPTAIVSEKASLGANVTIEPGVIIYPGVTIGDNSYIGIRSIIGVPPYGNLEPEEFDANTRIGENSVIRSGATIYSNVTAGPAFETGHNVTIRENTVFGCNNRIGTLSDIQGDNVFGDYVRLHSNVHVGKKSEIGNFVWLFPYVILTNDPHPPSEVLMGVKIHDFAVVATAAVVLPGIKLNRDCLVGAKALVKDDVPEGMVAAGNPAKIICDVTKLKHRLDPSKKVYPWKLHFDRGMPWEGIGFEAWEKENK